MTLTLMPSASDSVIAGRPASVAGILMKRLGRSTSHHSRRPRRRSRRCRARGRGSTSMETRPSTPGCRSSTGRSTSQAQRTSEVVSIRTASSTSTCADGEVAHLLVVGSAPLIASAKIVGLVVTPTTCARRPALQVPAAEAVAGQVVEPDGDAGGGQLGQLLFCAMSGAFRAGRSGRRLVSGRRWGGAGRRRVGPVGATGSVAAAAMLSCAAATTASAVRPNCS